MEHLPADSSYYPKARLEQIKADRAIPLYQRPPEEKNRVVSDTFDFFQQSLLHQGFTEYTDNSTAYQRLPNEKIIVRREDPVQIFSLFENQTGYTVGFEDKRYNNCVEWNPQTDGSRNIEDAHNEGRADVNGVVAVLGFHPDENHDLVKIEDMSHNENGVQRPGVRSYQGQVTPDKLEFITIRVPGHLLREEFLTEDEIDRVDEYHDALEAGRKQDPVMIYRTYLPPSSDKVQ